MTKFIFDEEMIGEALKANGWSSGWNSQMWVHENENPDYSSHTTKEAFAKLLYKCNLVPENVERCWEVEE